MRQEERTLITRYRNGPEGWTGPWWRLLPISPLSPGRLIIQHSMRTERSESPAIGSVEKGIGRRSTAIARCRSLIPNGFASDFELAVFRPRLKITAEITRAIPLFFSKKVGNCGYRSDNAPRACKETRVSSRREDPKPIAAGSSVRV